jgi:ABC-2 type transport system ATP-binding protein
MIEINNISKSYNSVEILNIQRLEIGKTEIVGIIGNNGSGKTTLLRILLDLIKPNFGSVTIKNILNNDGEKWRTIAGGYLDEDNLIDFLTPEEYFELTIKLKEKSTDILKKYYTLFDNFFMDEILNQKKVIGKFSKGNKQKIGVSASIMAETELLILDEPFSHLDPTSQIALKNLLTELNKRNGLTILITSHNLTFVEGLCSRIIVISKGKIRADITDTVDISASSLMNYF